MACDTYPQVRVQRYDKFLELPNFWWRFFEIKLLSLSYHCLFEFFLVNCQEYQKICISLHCGNDDQTKSMRVVLATGGDGLSGAGLAVCRSANRQ